MINGKGCYHTVVVTPTCHAGAVADNANAFLWTEIPNAIPRGGSAQIVSIRRYDYDDTKGDMDLYFAQTNNAGTAITGALGAATALTDMTDDEIKDLKPLAKLLFDYSSAASSATGAYNWDYTNGAINTLRLNHVQAPVYNSEITERDIEKGYANPGSIYFMGVNVDGGSKTFTASGLKFAITFQIS